MVAIGVDRYYAIKCPLKNRVSPHKAKLTILAVWLISLSLASVQLFVSRVEDVVIESPTFDNVTNTTRGQFVTQKVCSENWDDSDDKKSRKIYTIFNLFAVYFIPVIILGNISIEGSFYTSEY